VIRGNEEAAVKAVIKVLKGIQASESKRRTSQRFPATTGHAATASASTLMPAVTVTKGQKGIKTKQQGQRLLNLQCLSPRNKRRDPWLFNLFFIRRQ